MITASPKHAFACLHQHMALILDRLHLLGYTQLLLFTAACITYI
jgi:hypothetical protein